MSRRSDAIERAVATTALGPFLRGLREQRGIAQWKVGAAAGMDSTLLSKIELGDRLPTQEQAALLARFFGVPVPEVEARRIAAKFWQEHAENPAVGEAVQQIQETAPAYVVNKSVNRRGKGPR